MKLPYRLGLPAWGFAGWRDRYFADVPSRLASYARVFNAVEGNTTFYRIPDADTVARWRDAVNGQDFAFSFKLPREVTHDQRPDLAALDRFLDAIAPLGDHVGPLLVQFPASVDAAKLGRFDPVFDSVGARHRFVIEVRHRRFFTDPVELAPWLERYGAGRVVLDSRPLYLGDMSHPDVVRALHEKPDVPVVPAVYNGLAFVRLILHPDRVSNRPYLEEWADWAASYLADGVTTWMMIHCPNNLYCPSQAGEFHETLRRRVGDASMPALPPWPVPQQDSLF